MNVPLEITWRNIEKTPSLDALIRKKADRLQTVCEDLSSCRVAIEKAQHDRAGTPYRVRIDMTLPPGQELVVTRNPGEGPAHDPLPAVVRKAFEAARRRLKRFTERRQEKHPSRGVTRADADDTGVVSRLFQEEGYGFLRSLEGREVYFHRHSVLNGEFDRLRIGTGVRFVRSQGEMGPQASTVHIIDKPGARASTDGLGPSRPPEGW